MTARASGEERRPSCRVVASVPHLGDGDDPQRNGELRKAGTSPA